ncbi:hypothetical protein DPMN_112423 [Dreissena polymorpha]|uniref:Uncharacterized protein n=1 Tax=Dreissena polymorpha TaxID=45954 RepID=A0A9D4KFP0_DREPO|nr:hypothetical protein DPMN_112422 [Dreissena polymorpha]KAH3839004.1 hypothetical protein DPMN_112423 [Dreissena polymorpha]
MTKKGQSKQDQDQPKKEQNKGGKKRTKQEASPNSESDQPEKWQVMAESSPTAAEMQPCTVAAAPYAVPPVTQSYNGQYYAPHLQFMTPHRQPIPTNVSNQVRTENQYYLPSPPPPPTTPPPWAAEIMQDIKSIKLSVSKLDKLEKLVDKINARVEKLENESKAKDVKMSDVENAVQFARSEIEDTKNKIKETSSEIKVITNQYSDIKTALSDIKTKTDELEAKTNDLESRSMRENLLFYGLSESEQENCQQKVIQVISERLQLTDDIILDRAHRLGKPAHGKSRPIVAKFHYYSQRELVRTTATSKYDVLRNEGLGIGIQQTKAVLNKRRQLNDVFNREKSAGKQVKWAGSRLMVRNNSSDQFREVTC